MVGWLTTVYDKALIDSVDEETPTHNHDLFFKTIFFNYYSTLINF
jgi:hypothetical protein